MQNNSNFIECSWSCDSVLCY